MNTQSRPWTAADTRRALASACATYRAAPAEYRAEADVSLEAALLNLGVITPADIIESIYPEECSSTEQGVTVITADECIYIDLNGNVSRGAAE